MDREREKERERERGESEVGMERLGRKLSIEKVRETERGWGRSDERCERHSGGSSSSSNSSSGEQPLSEGRR